MSEQAIAAPRPSSFIAFTRAPEAISELDGLRAIAIMLVLGRHAVWPVYQTSQELFPIGSWDLAVPFLNGWIGVDLFFVLSGFLITHHILRRGGGRPLSRFGSYLSARALRIVPTYLAVLVLVIAGTIPLYKVAPEALTLRVGYHLLFLQDYFASNIVVPFWSLGVEEKFYLIAPFFVFLGFRFQTASRRYFFLSGLILLPMVLRAYTAILHPEVTDYAEFFRVFRSPFHLSFDGLAVGVCCAFLYRDWIKSDRPSGFAWSRWLFWISTAMVVSQLLFIELLGQIGWYQKILQPLVLSLTFGGLLLAAASGGAKGRLLSSRALLIVARISYPLYLIHIVFVPLALALTGFVSGADPIDFLRYLAIYLVLSFLAAFFLHYAVEKPFLILKDRHWKVQRP